MKQTDAIKMFAAIAHDGRLGLLRQLIETGPEGKTVGELTRDAGSGTTTVSAQLLVLTNAGLVESTREGRSIRYRTRFLALQGLIAFLFKDCCGNRPDICAQLLADLRVEQRV